MRRHILIVFFTFISSAYALDESAYPLPTDTQTTQFNTLIQETRCIVCQNQSVADSNAPLAKDLRGKIYRMVLDNKSDAEIKNYLVKRYGEFILLRPRWNKLTLLLWLFPLIGLLTAGILFYKLAMRPRQ